MKLSIKDLPSLHLQGAVHTAQSGMRSFELRKNLLQLELRMRPHGPQYCFFFERLLSAAQ